MFGTLGGPELLLILVIALIVFGPRKLPEIGKSVGKMMAEFRRASNDFKRTIEDEVEADKMRSALEPPSLDPAPPTEAAVPEGTLAQDGAPAPAYAVESAAPAADEEPVATAEVLSPSETK
jgi:Tat protein translocase TatB subunit